MRPYTPMRSINIISLDNAAGLSRDIDILPDVLSSIGVRVTVSRMSVPAVNGVITRRVARTVQRVANRLAVRRHRRASRRFDLNLFIEGIWPGWLPCARHNCLIPSQEWFRDEYRPYLPALDLLLCRTRHAQQVFSALGCRCEHIGFTSHDRYLPTCQKQYSQPFHLAGNSLEKGTEALLDLWRRHPDWPHLCIVQRRALARPSGLPNVLHVTRYLGDADLQRLQNSHGLHLCPSQVEAFGHSIVEAMSAQAVTVVTDAPPMNEVAAADRSLLVDCQRSEPMRLGTKFFVDEASLERRVGEALEMDDARRTSMGRNAREWFQENDRLFRKRLAEVIRGL